MNYEDRIRLELCGCRTDAPTGLTMRFCETHQPEDADRLSDQQIEDSLNEMLADCRAQMQVKP